MIKHCTLSLVAVIIAGSAPALAESSVSSSYSDNRTSGRELPPYLQCVPYAREQTGIQIYGDAHTWWDKAEGKYERGNRPKVGAVMAFQPHRNMQLGHIAAVSKVVDSRTVLLRHSNWSPINGRRGQIENDVRAIDVSPNNDWSMVRVWYDPIKDLGRTPWPIHGFIYPEKPRSFAPTQRMASAAPGVRAVAPAAAPVAAPVRAQNSPRFDNAFAALAKAPMPVAPKTGALKTGARPHISTAPASARQSSPNWASAPQASSQRSYQSFARSSGAKTSSGSTSGSTAQASRNDFSDVLAKYDN